MTYTVMYCRKVTAQQARRNSERFTTGLRRTESQPEDKWIVLTQGSWSKSMNPAVFRQKLLQHDSSLEKRRNTRLLIQKVNDPGAILTPSDYEISDVLPGKCSIVDHLYTKATSNGPWKFPTASTLQRYGDQRQLTDIVQRDIQVKVIKLNDVSNDELCSALEWIEKRVNCDESDWPAGTMAMQLCYTHVCRKDYSELLLPKHRGKTVVAQTLDPPTDESTDAIQFPNKIVFSGPSWTAIFEWPIEVEGDVFKMTNFQFPSALIDWLNKISAVQGIDIRHDAIVLQDIIHDNTGSNDFKFNAVVSLEALATAAGWGLNSMGYTAIPLITTGSLVVKTLSCRSRELLQPWQDCSSSVKWELMNIGRNLARSYRILLQCLLYDTRLIKKPARILIQ